jgi:alpha-1,6-mannosyltransferase
MQIVQIANFYGPRSGGLRTAIDELGAGYSQRGHQVALVVPGADADQQVLPSGVLRITVPASKLPMTGGYRAASRKAVSAITASLRPDVIEVSDRLTLRGMGSWAQRHGVRSVMISHERLDRLLEQALPDTVARSVADHANRATARDYDTVVCTTEFAREEFDRIGAANLARVPLGVDLDVFHPDRYDEALHTLLRRGNTFAMVHCGRLSVEKHVHRSIDAVSLLHDAGIGVHLIVVGDGPSRPSLERRAVGLPIEFVGFVSDRTLVASLLASADVAIAPGPHETFGLAALEALAAGTPVVVSRSSALAEIITPRCGAAASDTAASFAEAIAAVLSLPLADRKIRARRRGEQFGWPPAVDGMLAALAV